MSWKYYTAKELKQLLNLDDEEFHRELKKKVKADFKKDTRKLGFDNPDILLNEDYEMRLADPQNHNNYFDTGISIESYIED